MTWKHIAITCFFWHFASIGGAESRELRDYTLMDHEIILSQLRAGNHDKEGKNDYYFHATIYGVLSTPEERKLEFAEKKKIERDLGKFGEVSIEALMHWEAPGAKDPQVSINI